MRRTDSVNSDQLQSMEEKECIQHRAWIQISANKFQCVKCEKTKYLD